MKRFPLILAVLAALTACGNRNISPDGPNGQTDPQVGTGEHLADITYQLNVYSFADSDGDGWGDLKGVTQHLDYLEEMGVSALWLSPIQACDSYHGYDVSDYSAINPKLGTEADFQDLIDKAKAKGIDIYMDYVLNHSGKSNPWFIQACSDAGSIYRDYYVFSSNPTADVAAGKVDNFAGATSPGMGMWYAMSSSTGGRLHFKLDWSAKTVTVTETTAAAQASNPSATIWIYYGDGTLAGLYQTASNTYEITVDFTSSWGFLVRTSSTSWDGGTKWGGSGASLTLGTPYKLNNSTASDSTFAGGSSYFASFDKSMPDLNYGPYTSAATSAAFKDLAASADKWINMGVNGLRLDAVIWIYQRQTTANVEFLKQWYSHVNDTYKARGGPGDIYMVGEAWEDNATKAAPYFQGLPSIFDFWFWYALKDRINNGSGYDFASTINNNRKLYKNQNSNYIDAIKLTNHDEDRAASDLGRSLPKEKLAGAVLLTSPGKPFIYQGEELGYWGTKGSGDEYVRTPIKWTRSGSVPTKALGGKVDNSMLTATISVEAQGADDSSILNVYRKFGNARMSNKALQLGEMYPMTSGNNAVALWKRSYEKESVVVAHNFGSSQTSFTLSSGYTADNVLVSNGDVAVDGSKVTLGAYASAVFVQ